MDRSKSVWVTGVSFRVLQWTHQELLRWPVSKTDLRNYTTSGDVNIGTPLTLYANENNRDKLAKKRLWTLVESRNATVARALTEWRSHLINLDANNRLLYYRDLKVGTLDLSDADPIALAQLRGGESVKLGRFFSDPQRLRDAQRSMKQIANKVRAAAEEFGVPIGYLAIGMATWDDHRTPNPAVSSEPDGPSTDRPIRVQKTAPAAPVLLQPVEFELRPGSADAFVLSVGGEAFVNPVLLHMLTSVFDVEIDDAALLEDATDDDFIFDRLNKACTAVPGFAIEPRNLIGTFTYMKQPMVEDLDESELEFLAASDLVAAIAGVPEAKDAVRSSGSQVSIDAPDVVPPTLEYLVLDADASQSYVINAASAGQNLVVQGPPGTGKSQTIANLIAELVAHDRSVLFVAQKRAAITAVLNRLDRVNLGGLALDMFEGAGSRRTVVAKLGAALDAMSEARNVPVDALHNRLATARDRLSSHQSAVHEERTPWSLSLWSLLAIDVGQPVDAHTTLRVPTQELLKWQPGVLDEIASAAAELGAAGGYSTELHTRQGWAIDGFASLEELNEWTAIAEHLSVTALPHLRSSIEAVVGTSGLACPNEPTRARDLVNLIRRTHVVWSAAPTVLPPEADLEEIREAAAATAPKAWLAQHGGKLGWSQRRAGRKKAAGLVPAGQSNDARHATLVEAMQLRDDWAALAVSPVPTVSNEQAEAVLGGLTQLERDLAKLQQRMQHVELGSLDFDQLSSFVGSLSSDPTRLRLPLIRGLRDNLRGCGLGDVLREMSEQELSPTIAESRVRWVFARSAINQITSSDERLAGITPAQLERWAEEFLSADQEHLHVNAARVQRAAAEKMAAALNAHRGQEAEIKRQVRRKRGFMSVRGLFTVAPDVMTAIKPCWAMSPLMVSQMLPNQQIFDVVIFDEASQVMPSDAIPAIARGRQVVVAGDRHQLPPTDFFSKLSAGNGFDDDGDVDEGDDDTAEITAAAPETRDVESILDTLDVVLAGQSRTLTWHYRSKDEKLIATSNAYVYHHQLTTFPGSDDTDRIAFKYVPPSAGIGNNNKSPSGEVARVVDLAIEHARTRPQESLGVIAFGSDHARRIQAQLDQRLKDEPDVRDFFADTGNEPFFIKNIERVQGDEREAIILTVGYGRSSDGRMRYMWGPLLEVGGERRLNVAISRARSRMTLVASFTADDVDPTASSSAGFQLMYRFMQFMSSNGDTFGGDADRTVELNPFEVDVLQRLEAAGLSLEPQWGVGRYRIDFAVRNPQAPGKFILAIECDGASYHSGLIARERDRLRQEHLERLGWRFHRIWSTDWWTDPAPQIDGVLAAYREALESTDGRSLRPDPSDIPASDPTTTRSEESIAQLHSASVAAPAARSNRPPIPPGLKIGEYTIHDLIDIVRWIKSDDVVRTDDQILEEVMDDLGFSRRGSRITAAINEAIGKAPGK